ncbi:error-prone DNA polymerase [Gammaproteobacteria bacterium]|nr:error-prone DNA polymerase [Gammaproteobacteria bacterium]
MIPKNLPSDTPQPTVVASPAWAEDSVPAISDLSPCLTPHFPPYAELYSLSNFSFLRAASFPEELVEQAHELGYSALALCDECSLSGIVRAHVAAKQRGLKLLIGSVLGLRVATPRAAESRRAEFPESIPDLRVVLLARTRRGYGQLSHLISCARRAAAKGGYWVDRQIVEDNLPEECFALWLPHSADAAERHACQAAWLQRIFGTNLRLGVQLHLQGDDRGELQRMTQLGNRFGITLCAAGGVLMHEPSRRVLLDTLAAIRLGRPLDKLGYAAEPNNERHLRDRGRLAKLYPPELLEETVRIADACDFSLDELRYEYPRELVPPQYTPSGWLRELTEAGIRERWPKGVSPKVRNLIEHELGLVKELGYEHYLLTVHDLVAFARRERILCQGRGSAANSAVCYCLGITEVDPARVDVLFERFISKERDEPPDIDVDFENSRREEVIQYIYARYGRGRAALAATVISYQSRSAIRDVGKALGFGDAVLDHLSKAIYWWGENLEEQLADAEVDRADPKVQLLVELAGKLIGFPRHLSQHVGGFVISQGPLTHLVPIENAAMVDRTIIQWEKNDLEALGLLKIDVLALGMLSAVRKCLDLVSDYSDEPLTIQNIPAEDPAVYDMMCAADTIGVFQIESRAQMSMLPRLKPRCYYDLVIQIAIVRPGPIQGEMVHPYLNRRSGREAISYPSEAVRSVLERTLGVPIFQEQVMQLAMVAAGFSGGEADGLRRAMAAWKRKGGLEHYREKLVTGMLDRGYEPSFAEQLFNQIKGFGDYGFPESHSASFALIAYVSSWLKCYHPAAFCCALLNSQPMGFYAPAQLIKDAQRHGVEVLPAEVNESLEGCSLEAVDTVRASKATESCDSSERRKSPRVQGAEGSQRLRIGFNLVKGLSAQAAAAIVEARRGGAYVSIQDLVFRTGIDRRDLEALAAADALRGLAGDRHRAFWHAAGVITAQGYAASHSQTGSRAHSLTHSQTGSQPHSLTQADRPIADLFDDAASGDSDFGLGVMLPLASESQNVAGDYAATGFTLRRHPLALLREHLDCFGANSSAQLGKLGNDQVTKVAGLVTCRQRPMTASGVTFLTLEDEAGHINVVVWPALGERLRPILRQAMLIGVVGRVQVSEGVIHVIADNLVDLTSWLGELSLSSRDFT